jgi:hypothetical protein
MTLHATCPAANLERGTLSLNACDVRCRIVGNLRDADGAPCTGDYWECRIWRGEKERLWKNRRAAVAQSMQRADGEGWAAA